MAITTQAPETPTGYAEIDSDWAGRHGIMNIWSNDMPVFMNGSYDWDTGAMLLPDWNDVPAFAAGWEGTVEVTDAPVPTRVIVRFRPVGGWTGETLITAFITGGIYGGTGGGAGFDDVWTTAEETLLSFDQGPVVVDPPEPPEPETPQYTGPRIVIRPSPSGRSFRIHYIATPFIATSGTDAPLLSARWRELIATGAAIKLLAVDDEIPVQLATVYTNLQRQFNSFCTRHKGPGRVRNVRRRTT